MNRIAIVAIAAVALAGCRLFEVTPDGSWKDFHTYYTPGAITAKPFVGTADLRIVRSGDVDRNVAELGKQGKKVIGSFLIDDGTDISYAHVNALARKLNASAVVWSSEMISSDQTLLPNADIGLVGTDYTRASAMTARRVDETLAEQTIRKHVIYMLGAE